MQYSGSENVSADRLSPGNGGRLFFIRVLFLALLLVPVRGQAGPDGGLPGSFSRQGVGARALGLGGSFGGLADDASAIYWNPAGLARLIKPEVTLNRVTLFEGTNNDFVGFGLPFKGFGAVGAGYLRQTSGDFQKREAPFDAPTAFAVTNSMLQLGWAAGIPESYTARVLPGQVSLGLGVKNVTQQVDSASGSGAGADAGLLYRYKKSFSMGLTVQNIVAPSVKLVTKASAFPRVVDISPVYTRDIGKGLKATLAARTNYFGGRLHPGAGSEVWYLNRYALRAGIEVKGVSVGVGARLGNSQVDYAILLHEIEPSHIMSFSLKFGMTGAERAEEIRRGMKKLDQDEAQRLARSYYLEGLTQAREGNLAAAIGNLEKAELLDPADKQTERKLAALKAESALLLNRRLVETSAILARQQYEQGNILGSLEYWKAVLQAEPANAEAGQAVETIKSRLGSQEAETLAKAQKDILDVQVSQLLARAQVFREQGLLAEASGEVRKALELDSASERAKVLIAELDLALRERVEQLSRQAALEDEKKDFKASVEAYQKILHMAPAAPGINEKLKAARAAVSVKVKPELKKEAERLYYVAVDQYLKKKYADSAATLARIFELDPGNEGAVKLKAKVEAALK